MYLLLNCFFFFFLDILLTTEGTKQAIGPEGRIVNQGSRPQGPTYPGTRPVYPGSIPGNRPGTRPVTIQLTKPGKITIYRPSVPGNRPGTIPGYPGSWQQRPYSDLDNTPPLIFNYQKPIPGIYPGTVSGTYPGTVPGTYPGTVPGTYPGTVPGTYPGTKPYPASVPGNPMYSDINNTPPLYFIDQPSPGTVPGTYPGTMPGTYPGTMPGTYTGTKPYPGSVPGNPMYSDINNTPPLVFV